MTDSKATPRPWMVGRFSLCEASTGKAVEFSEAANTALIVEAVNNYDPLKARIAELEGENNRLKAQAGMLRMCLNCGRYKDVALPRQEPLPGCVDPETGLSACTFDHTPQEAWAIWRDRAHKERERSAELKASLARIDNMGQTAVPDHWDFRQKARSIVRAALGKDAG